jgi:hypothetical protein
VILVLSSSEKPTAAFILSLIGGLLAIVQSFLILLFFSVTVPFTPVASILGFPAFWLFVCGAAIFIGAVMLYLQPERIKEWGILILVFSILGGINILGIVGGALAIAWTPSLRPRAYYTSTSIRVCPVCKRVVAGNAVVCPYCGTRLP